MVYNEIVGELFVKCLFKRRETRVMAMLPYGESRNLKVDFALIM